MSPLIRQIIVISLCLLAVLVAKLYVGQQLDGESRPQPAIAEPLAPLATDNAGVAAEVTVEVQR